MAPVIPAIFLTILITATASPDSDGSIFTETKTITHKKSYLPPMVILGFPNGTIARCPYQTPNSCEVYHSGNSSVTATLVHGEYLFASTESGAILRCIWGKIHSCIILHQIDREITSLAVSSGFIYAGLYNGTILRCELIINNSCRIFTNHEHGITSLAAAGSTIYAGSYFTSINRCSEDGCTNLQETGCLAIQIYCEILGLSVIGREIYGVRYTGWIYRSNEYSSNSSGFIIGPYSGYVALANYGRKLYVLKRDSGVFLVNLDTEDRGLTPFAEHVNAETISFAYGTYSIQEQYITESEKCNNLHCPPLPVYYNIKNRVTFEVFVKDGALYDCQGILDTSDADEIYLQKAAIFVMGPDGQILLSKYHKRDLLRTSSLLAGNPVSGAGLMVVEQGKIKGITACSAHYMPDVKLNEQLVEALYAKGYMGKIDSRPCVQ